MTFGRPLPEISLATPQDLAPWREQAQPVVLRGLLRDWPAVATPDIATYLAAFDSGRPAMVMTAPPEIEGRPFYTSDLGGLNFTKQQASIGQLLGALASLPHEQPGPMLYMGSAPTSETLPGFAEANPAPGLPTDAIPRIWIGGPVTVQTHFDTSDNVACVVAGTRAFTLFPPEQVANLYVGPLDFTLAGQPVSMVQFDRGADLVRFPRFEKAQATAMSATLLPGDAIYIPPLWWHHVRSLDRLNVMVNYWWLEGHPEATSPFDCLIHGLLALRDLPPPRRAAWRAFFDCYIFDSDRDTHAHIPEHARSVLGELSPSMATRMRQFIINGLARR